MAKRVISEQTRQKMRAAHLGKHHSGDTKKKMSRTRQGREFSDATRLKMSRSQSKRNRDYMTGEKNHNAKAVNQKDMNGRLVRRWGSLSDIARDGEYTSLYLIRLCCNGKRDSYAGYIWEFAND